MVINQHYISESIQLPDFIMLDLRDIDSQRIKGALRGRWNSFIYVTGAHSVLQIDFVKKNSESYEKSILVAVKTLQKVIRRQKTKVINQRKSP